MCYLYPYNNIKLLRKFFFTLMFILEAGSHASTVHSAVVVLLPAICRPHQISELRNRRRLLAQSNGPQYILHSHTGWMSSDTPCCLRLPARCLRLCIILPPLSTPSVISHTENTVYGYACRGREEGQAVPSHDAFLILGKVTVRASVPP